MGAPPARRIDSVLLIAFGGPEGPDQVRPFLDNVLRGRRVSPDRVEEVAHHYERFGGVSPLNAITRRQAAGLGERLARLGLDLPVFVGMRNWHPFLTDTLREMSTAGLRRAAGVVMAPHRSFSSRQQYYGNVEDARAALRTGGHQDVEVAYTKDWFDHPKFVEGNEANVRAAAARLPDALPPPRLVFTAHSLPEAMPGATEYAGQVRTSARLVAAAAGLRDWAVAFQSRSGRPDDPWLGPDIVEYLRRHRAEMGAVVISPIGFVADHIEVLYDLDHEAAAACGALGLPMARAATVNDAPVFLDMLAEVVRELAAGQLQIG